MAKMPTEIETSKAEIALASPYYSMRMQWNEIQKLSLAPPLLPEGYLLQTKRGQFFLSGKLEAADELAQQIEQQSGVKLVNKAR